MRLVHRWEQLVETVQKITKERNEMKAARCDRVLKIVKTKQAEEMNSSKVKTIG